MKAREEPTKINNKINKSTKAVEQLNEAIGEIEEQKEKKNLYMAKLNNKSEIFTANIEAKAVEYNEKKPQMNQLERNIDRAETNLKTHLHDDAEMQQKNCFIQNDISS
jgi:chromosome segregation ATPase